LPVRRAINFDVLSFIRLSIKVRGRGGLADAATKPSSDLVADGGCRFWTLRFGPLDAFVDESFAV